MTIFVQWKETELVFSTWRYVGGGVAQPIFVEVVKTKRVRFSNEESPARLQQAREYIMTERPGAQIVIEKE